MYIASLSYLFVYIYIVHSVSKIWPHSGKCVVASSFLATSTGQSWSSPLSRFDKRFVSRCRCVALDALYPTSSSSVYASRVPHRLSQWLLLVGLLITQRHLWSTTGMWYAGNRWRWFCLKLEIFGLLVVVNWNWTLGPWSRYCRCARERMLSMERRVSVCDPDRYNRRRSHSVATLAVTRNARWTREDVKCRD